MVDQQKRNLKTGKAKHGAHYKLAAPTLVKCPACGEYKVPHKMCSCGEHNGKTIVEKQSKGRTCDSFSASWKKG